VHSSFLFFLLVCWSGQLTYGKPTTRSSCITVGGPATGSACVFPFNYNGVSHSNCTTVDDTKPWCSTQTDANNDHVSGVGAWGYCDENCSGSGSPSPTECSVTSGPEAGSACVFPFTFMGVSHSSCTTIDGDSGGPWCFTKTSWGYCGATCPVEGNSTAPTSSTTTNAPQESCQCGVKGGDSHTRIVGGHETKEHEYPWQVLLVLRDGQLPWCGGTLISSTHVLTAAHCTVHEGREMPASTFQLRLGEHNTADREFIEVEIAEIINHPDYKNHRSYLESDYAILRLANPVPFTKKVSPACLPANLSATYAGVLATTTGWGRLIDGGSSPDVLQEVDVTVMTNAKCKTAYGDFITSNMVCAADTGKDSCQGDSGGPIIAPENGRQALIGVVSWGWGCADPRYPGVYARVTDQMDWIVANTAGTFSSTCKALN